MRPFSIVPRRADCGGGETDRVRIPAIRACTGIEPCTCGFGVAAPRCLEDGRFGRAFLPRSRTGKAIRGRGTVEHRLQELARDVDVVAVERMVILEHLPLLNRA